MQDRTPTRNERGFSLVELLVVITIIGILATTVTVKVIGALSKAKITRAEAEVIKIRDAVNMYYMTVGRMPETLQQLSEPPPGGKGFEEGILDVQKDPWGHEYQYVREQGRKFHIVCMGSKESSDNEGPDESIDSDTVGKEGGGGPGPAK